MMSRNPIDWPFTNEYDGLHKLLEACKELERRVLELEDKVEQICPTVN